MLEEALSAMPLKTVFMSPLKSTVRRKLRSLFLYMSLSQMREMLFERLAYLQMASTIV